MHRGVGWRGSRQRGARSGSCTDPVRGRQCPGSHQLVQDVASNILKALDANRAAYVNNPKMVRDLADKYLLPYFDTRYAAQLVLGRSWPTATEDQRARFIEAFKNRCCRTTAMRW